MTPSDQSFPELLRGYAFRSGHYMHNALEYLNAGELEKSSEFLWGSMAQAVKAVAAVREITLPTHGAIWDFARQLCQELGDSVLFDAFRDANRLHGNFYEAGLTREMILDSEARVRQGVAKLIGMIPREVLDR